MLKELLNEQTKKIVKTYLVKPEESNLDMQGSEKYYPSIHLNSKNLPAIKDWEVGEEYSVMLKIKQTSKSIENDQECSGSFEIREILVLPHEEKEEEKHEEKEKWDSNLKKLYGLK